MLQHLPTKSVKKNGNPKQNPDAIINGGGGGLVGWSVSRLVFSERALLSHPNFQQNNYFIRQLCKSDKRRVFARHLVAISPNKSGATHPVLKCGMRNICPSIPHWCRTDQSCFAGTYISAGFLSNSEHLCRQPPP